MISRTDIEAIGGRLERIVPEEQGATRALALYSAAIAVSDEALLEAVIGLGSRFDLGRDQFYEIVLQSYLFLGFPRMLIAADQLGTLLPVENQQSRLSPVGPAESQAWFDQGVALCQTVYGNNFEPLKKRVESFAPDIFRWMVVEGYGKVLSRPGLSIIDRELAIVACLMVENHRQQLFSHLRGAFNVGADAALVKQVIEDVAPLASEGYSSALEILKQLGER